MKREADMEEEAKVEAEERKKT